MSEVPLQALVIVVVLAVGIVVYLAWFASRVKVYRCSACGQEFRAKGLAGRVGASGVPRVAWYYTTCPKCGKRSRNLLVGYAPRTDLTDPTSGTRDTT
jgi:DNA-directed RNA polymerase subunit RPC12/RpoP